jgi:hypothetical protein
VLLAVVVPRAVVRSLLFALVLSAGIVIVFDIMAHVSGAWFVPTVFGNRIFGVAPWEDVLLLIFLITPMLLSYERFGQHRRTYPIVPGRWLRFMVFAGMLMLIATALWLLYPSSLIISRAYLKSGLLAIALPVAYELIRHRSLRGKFIRTSLYWIYVLLLYEMLAVGLGWWSFPAHDFVGWVHVGTIAFPLEEFVFWIVGITAGILSYYEFFVDDNQ